MILLVLYLYILLFTMYMVVLAITALVPIHRKRDKYTPKDANLCVVVYATGECETLPNLISQLQNQSYPKNAYTTYVVLDKCSNVSEVTLQTEHNVNVISVDNMEPIGKSQAYSIVAEKLQDIKDIDAYVFLSAQNYIDSEFLKNANFYLTKYKVFNPSVSYLPQNDKMTFWQNVKMVYSLYVDKFFSLNRTKLGLTNIVNTDSFVINKDLLNKMAVFDFRNVNSEVNYTFKLADEGVSVAHIADLKVFKSIDNYVLRIPSLSMRLKLLFDNLFKPVSLNSKEFLISLAAPNWLVFILSYFVILKASYVLPGQIDYSVALISAVALMIAVCISFANSSLYPKEFLYLFSYPLYSIWHIIYNFPPIRGIRNLLIEKTKKHVVDKMVVDVIVSDGRRDFQCQLELISEDGLAKVTFINKGKKYTTKNNHLRMVDALKELTTKLNDFGLTLKICQCCKYFQPIVDGSTNMVKGACNCQFAGRTPGDMIPTLIWNTCPCFEKINVVNLF